MLRRNDLDHEAILRAGVVRIEQLENMLAKKLDLIRCGISGNYNGDPKDNTLYTEVVELLNNA